MKLNLFNSLVFTPHPQFDRSRTYFYDKKGNHAGLVHVISRAQMRFPNGYTASVVHGLTCTIDGIGEYEVAVLHNDKLCYDTIITQDVEGKLNADEVNTMLYRIAALHPKS